MIFNCYLDKIQVLRNDRSIDGVSYFCTDDLSKDDLHEKKRWTHHASKAYKEGKKVRFYAGKWRGNGGALADFYKQ